MVAIFTEAQRDMLTAAFNRIVPAEDNFPGAGDLGGAQFVEKMAEKNIRLRRLFDEGLAQLEIAAAQHSSRDDQSDAGFAELSAAEQDDTLRQVEAEQPDFFRELLRQCYNSYYTNPEVFDRIGYTLPGPADYKPLPFDESLLEPVRQRGQIWRSV